MWDIIVQFAFPVAVVLGLAFVARWWEEREKRKQVSERNE